MIARQQIRPEPAHDAFGVMPKLYVASAIVDVVARHKQGADVGGRDLARGHAFIRGRPVPGPVLQRGDERIATHGLPFDLPHFGRCVDNLARFRRNEPARAPSLEVQITVEESGESIPRRHLIGEFRHLIVGLRVEHDRRAVGIERVYDLPVVTLITESAVKPELVPDDPAAQVPAVVLQRVKRRQTSQALVPQLLIDVGALQSSRRPVRRSRVP